MSVSRLQGSLHRPAPQAPVRVVTNSAPQSRISAAPQPQSASPGSLGTTFQGTGQNAIPFDPIQTGFDDETEQILQFQLDRNNGQYSHPKGRHGQMQNIARHQYALRHPEYVSPVNERRMAIYEDHRDKRRAMHSQATAVLGRQLAQTSAAYQAGTGSRIQVPQELTDAMAERRQAFEANDVDFDTHRLNRLRQAGYPVDKYLTQPPQSQQVGSLSNFLAARQVPVGGVWPGYRSSISSYLGTNR